MDNRCEALIKHLSDRYEFSKVFWCNMPEQDYSAFDLIYYAGFYMVGSRRDKAFKQAMAVSTVSGCVNADLREVASKLDLVAAYTIPNRQLAELARFTDSEIFYAPNGVDADLFCPADSSPRTRFTVGWAGNSRHAGKRVEELQRACDLAGAQLKVQDVADKVPHEQMPEFYHSIDCYCCPSVSEGSNNCLLEAASCGVPLIATPTGNACEIIGCDGGFYVRPDLGDLGSVIEMMMVANRKKMGETLRSRILSGWQWGTTSGYFADAFDYALGKR